MSKKEESMNNSPEVIHRRDEVREEDVPEFVRKWYGWATPTGLGMFLVALAIAAVLFRVALVGLH
jgi:hypothetical protein